METKIKRDELIEKLVDIEYGNIEWSTVKEILKNGVIGFGQMNDKELIEQFEFYKECDYFEDYAEEVEIID